MLKQTIIKIINLADTTKTNPKRTQFFTLYATCTCGSFDYPLSKLIDQTQNATLQKQLTVSIIGFVLSHFWRI